MDKTTKELATKRLQESLAYINRQLKSEERCLESWKEDIVKHEDKVEELTNERNTLEKAIAEINE